MDYMVFIDWSCQRFANVDSQNFSELLLTLMLVS